MRSAVARDSAVVVKVGSSSLTGARGGLDGGRLGAVVDELMSVRRRGNLPILVTSGAIAAGFPALGMSARPDSIADLQVAAAVGQSLLMDAYAEAFGSAGVKVGQVLLTKDVLGNRSQYLNARAALTRMLELGIVPVVNENDTVVVDEVKFGDNDQLAAIVSHLIGAGMLIILTDTEGLYTDDPRFASDAQLVKSVRYSDEVLDVIRSSSTATDLGRGGVATKVMAARMAALSAVPTVIAPARHAGIAVAALDGEDVGTWVAPRSETIAARKLWIGFGLPSAGSVGVDAGAARALTTKGGSLLSVGVTAVDGSFERGDAVEILDERDELIAKGISRMSAEDLRDVAGRATAAGGGEVVHRDDLVVLT